MKQILMTLSALSLFFCVSFSHAEENYRFQAMWPALKQPWYFYHPTGVAADADGYVYIASTDNDFVSKFTSNGEFVSRWGKEGNGNGEFNEPVAIAADKDGFVYVTDMNNNRIQKFTSHGVFVMQWGKYGSGDGEFKHPHGIAVSFSGKVYVADTENSRIQVFTTEGKFIGKWEQAGAAGRFDLPQDVTVTQDGMIYVADTSNDRILKFDEKGNLILQWEIAGSADSQFPHGITSDGYGNVYVTDKFNNRIQKFTSDGVFIRAWGQEGNLDGMLNYPWGMAYGKDGYIYVADMNNQRIQKFTTEGVFTDRWGVSGNPGFFNKPEGIAVSPEGFVFVCDTENHRIQKFARNGKLEMHWGREGKAGGEFDTPHGITVDKAGFVYIADTINNRVQKFSQQGIFVTSWGQKGNLDGEFDEPYAIDADNQGHIYVIEWGNRRIQKFDAEGNFICKWGKQGSGNSEFISPLGIAADSNGFVYVTDAVNRCVQKFSADGTFVDKWGQKGSGQGDFDLPSGISVESADGQDFIYVADSGNHRIQKFSSDGSFISQWGESGYMPGQMSYPGALAFDSDGNIFLADTDNHRIQIFRKSENELREKAILIAGGGPYPGNRLWDATCVSANYACRCMNYRGFSKETIYYLSADTDIDLDNNGKFDDVDGIPSAAALHKAIQESSDADRVVLYFVDHGGDQKFRLSESETLSASDLNTWLNDFQTDNSKEVIVIYDACNGGSFISELGGSQSRILISGADSDQNAHFINQGSISFSSFFWTHIFNGLDVKTGFEKAENALAAFVFTQKPVMEKSGTFADKPGEEPKPVHIGAGTGFSPDETQIRLTVTNHDDTIHAEVNTDYPEDFTRVWAVLIPPQYSTASPDTPVLELPSADLFPVSEDVYKCSLPNPMAEGYTVIAYAKDRFGNTYASNSEPADGSSMKKHRAILAGSDILSATNIQTAYYALKFQGYEEDTITVFAPENTNGIPVKANPSQADLHQAIKDCTGENTRDLVIYLTGEGSEKGFHISSSEILSVQTLNAWLNELQNRFPGEIVLIADADYAGNFLPGLISRTGKKQIVISGTSADRKRISEGEISFSAFFWKQIHAGDNLYKAFAIVKQNLQLLSQLPEDGLPLLDDNGNGMGNERVDGQRAEKFIIGNGIRLADNTPIVNEIQAEKILHGETSFKISANFSSFENISNVWAVISRPFHADDPEQGAERIELAQSRTEQGKYEVIYQNFNVFGMYSVSFYAEDEAQNISLAKKSAVFQAVGKDVYEPDNTLSAAGIITIDATNSQHRSLHSPNDTDWVKFYGIKGEIYTIQTVNPGKVVANHIPELWNSKGKIDTEIREDRTENPAQVSKTILWTCPENGMYYVCIRPDSASSVQTQEYYLEIFTEKAVFPVWIIGIVTDALTGLPVSNVRIVTSIGSSSLSRPSGYYRIVQEPCENMKITVEADGYVSRIFENVSISEGGIRVLDILLEAKLDCVDCVDNCPDDLNKTDPGICGCGKADADADGDGFLNCVDNCPDDPNKTVPGICDCGIPDTDSDGDGSLDCVDKCPDDPAKTETGICGCGIADTDSDKDSTPDCKDQCPNDPLKTEPGICGCEKADTDSDKDSTPDCKDQCPNDPLKTEPGICGCEKADTDSDKDGTPDCNDKCPNDPNKTEPEKCGCGNPEPEENGLCEPLPPVVNDADRDGDGTPDCKDNCPDDPGKTEPGICDCGIPDTDRDGDSSLDCVDKCPDDPNKTEPGICGCGIADTDTDNDGIPDCKDQCSNDPLKTEPGICGCGKSDEDGDGDGTPDCKDECPDNPNKTEPGIRGCNVADRDDNGNGTADCLEPEQPDTLSRQIIVPVPPNEDVSGSGCFIRTFSAEPIFFLKSF